jgi:hypothetical protein
VTKKVFGALTAAPLRRSVNFIVAANVFKHSAVVGQERKYHAHMNWELQLATLHFTQAAAMVGANFTPAFFNKRAFEKEFEFFLFLS